MLNSITLTNFVYSFANKYNLTSILNKLKTNITDLQSVNLIVDNWKLVKNNYIQRNTGWYIVIHKNSNLWKIEKINSSEKYGTRFFSDIVYKWELNNEPQIPTINSNTGKITDWSVDNQNKVKNFLNKYLDVIIQENIRVQ